MNLNQKAFQQFQEKETANNPQSSGSSSRKLQYSFQNILKLTLSKKIQKQMISEEPLFIKNIRFREGKEFINQDFCTICFLPFDNNLKPRNHWYFVWIFPLNSILSSFYSRVCGNSVCLACCSHKVFRDQINSNKACDLCFLKLLARDVFNIFEKIKNFNSKIARNCLERIFLE